MRTSPSLNASRSTGRAAARPGLFSTKMWALLVAVALGGAALLVPREQELMNRLEKDGKYDRLLELTLGEEWEHLELTPAKFGQLLDTCRDSGWSGPTMHALTAVISVSKDMKSLLPELDSRGAAIPPGKLEALRRTIAERALAVSEPATAAIVYGELADAPDFSLEDLRLGLSAHRYSGRIRQAFDFCGKYLASHGKTLEELPTDVRHIIVALHREVNESGKAFELLRMEARDDLGRENAELFDLMAATAAESLKTADALPLLMQYLDGLECNTMSWQEIHRQRDGLLKKQSTVIYRKRATVVAAQLAWNTRVGEAFDINLRLAALGEEAALDRCVQSYVWAGRHESLAELLDVVEPERYQFLRGKLAASRGRNEDAERCFRSLVEGREKGNAEVWETLGHLLDGQGLLQKATDAYRQAMTLDPKRTHLLPIRARLHVALREYPQALECYRAIPENEQSHKTIEDYGLLAESMREDDDMIRAYEMMERLQKVSTVELTYDLAKAYRDTGRLEEERRTLESGLKTHPKSSVLTLALADHLTRTGLADEALELLMANYTPGDGRYVTRVVRLAPEAADPTVVLSWIQSQESHISWTDQERVEIAEMTEELGDLPRAILLYSRIPGMEGEGDRVRADMEAQAGRLSEALKSQQSYMQWKAPGATHQDWTTLGDLYQANGKAEEARGSYLRALESAKRVASGPFTVRR